MLMSHDRKLANDPLFVPFFIPPYPYHPIAIGECFQNSPASARLQPLAPGKKESEILLTEKYVYIHACITHGIIFIYIVCIVYQ